MLESISLVEDHTQTEDIFEELNPEQREAVLYNESPLLVLAGAGTGKTRVLTSKIAHLISSGQARSYEILSVTFTNKAAREMKSRVEKILDHPVDGWWIGTFHSISTRILRQYAERIDRSHQFTILDDQDQVKLIKQLIEAEQINPKKLPPRAVQYMIQRWKDRGLTPEKVTDSEKANAYDGMALKLYKYYQQRLETLNAVDFGDLILLSLELFSKHPDIAQRFQEQFKYILVDEYQDTNIAQYMWLRSLAKKPDGSYSICCVGDEDQSIYGWRGAEIGNILRFETDYPEAKIVRLEQNYRSTPQILEASSTLIKKNNQRLGKTLWTELPDGDNLKIISVWDSDEETRFISDELEALQRKGHSLDEMAILVRASFQTRGFEERLLKIGIPYKVIGGPKFYERQEVRDALAYFRLVLQPNDDLAFERIVNTPKRGIGATTIKKIYEFARERQYSLFLASQYMVQSDEYLSKKVKTTLFHFLQQIQRWQQYLTHEDHVPVAQTILDESGYTAMWKNSKSLDASSRLENLKELMKAIEEYQDLPAFMDHVSLVMEREEDSSGEQVSIMTLHAAKGLEFDSVFLPGWEEGLFPHQKSLAESGTVGLEEERRLAYVGLTRAKQRAFITHAMRRKMYYQWQDCIASRFIADIRGDQKSAQKTITQSPQKIAPFLPPSKPRLDPAKVNMSKKLHLTDRVVHPKFGKGTIVAQDGDKASVVFDKGEVKKVLISFLEILKD